MGGNTIEYNGVTYTLKNPSFGLTAEIDDEGQEINTETGECQFVGGVGTYKLIKIKHFIASASNASEITTDYMKAMPPAAAAEILKWINKAETDIDANKSEDQNAESTPPGGGTTD